MGYTKLWLVSSVLFLSVHISGYTEGLLAFLISSVEIEN